MKFVRFGDGYTIILRLTDPKSDPDACPANDYMRKSFPSIELKEWHHNVLQYQLPSHACCLSRIFDVLANNCEEMGIMDFSVSQTTLDQVRVTMELARDHSDVSDMGVSEKKVMIMMSPSCIADASKCSMLSGIRFAHLCRRKC